MRANADGCGYAAGNGLAQPRYTIGGLFESGKLGLEAETALEEIRSIREGFQRYTSPSRGWLSPRYSDNKPEVPRNLASPSIWQRYTRWRRKYAVLVVQPSPSLPWGLSVAGLVVSLATTPMTFEEAARLLGWKQTSVVELVIRAIEDYGPEPGEAFEPFGRNSYHRPRLGKGSTPRHRGLKGGKRG